MNKQKTVTLAISGIVWLVSVLKILAPKLGLGTVVFPRPSPDYTLYLMIVSALVFVALSVSTAYNYLNPRMIPDNELA
jgi:hypothetical protein